MLKSHCYLWQMRLCETRVNFLLWDLLKAWPIVDPKGGEEEMGVLRPFKTGGSSALPQSLYPKHLEIGKCQRK